MQLGALITAVLASTSGCAVADQSIHSALLETQASPTAAIAATPIPTAEPPAAASATGTSATGASEAGASETGTSSTSRPTIIPPAARIAGTGEPDPSGSSSSTTHPAADATSDATTDTPVEARPEAATEAEPDAWAEPLRERPQPTVEEVVEEVPERGSVDLVTVRDIDDRPVVASVTVAGRANARTVVSDALADPDVLDVSVAGVVRVQGAVDPYRSAQWGMTRMSAEQVWAAQQGKGVKVAVLDTGVDGSHSDLAGVVLPGSDLVSGGNGTSDPHGHGTHVAGVIAAVANNGIGVAGLAQGARILPVRVLGADGTGTDADVARGIVWAVAAGAQVINMSVGSPDYSAAEDAAVAYAIQQGVVVVSAAGNLRKQGNPAVYPAAFPSVIGVGASDTSDRTATFSSTGPGVDLVAPGMDIVSTYPPNTYAYMDGTSMSTPFVSATAALIRAAAPNTDVAQVSAILTRTAKDLAPAGRDDASGHGLAQPVQALTLARQVATGSVVLPGSTSSAAPSILAVTSAPSRSRYQSLARVTFRLTVSGRPLNRARVTMCVATAPRQKSRCLTRATTSSGTVSLSARALGTLTFSARYAGTATVAPTVSRPAIVGVLPRVQVRAGSRLLSLTMGPVATGARIVLQRKIGPQWRSVTSRLLPPSGRLTFTRLVRSALYRVALPETDRTVAAVSSTVRIR